MCLPSPLRASWGREEGLRMPTSLVLSTELGTEQGSPGALSDTGDTALIPPPRVASYEPKNHKSSTGLSVFLNTSQTYHPGKGKQERG